MRQNTVPRIMISGETALNVPVSTGSRVRNPFHGTREQEKEWGREGRRPLLFLRCGIANRNPRIYPYRSTLRVTSVCWSTAGTAANLMLLRSTIEVFEVLQLPALRWGERLRTNKFKHFPRGEGDMLHATVLHCCAAARSTG